MIIDCQVHAYERNHPGRPWVEALPGPAEMTGDQLVAQMDSVGVDAAILVSPFTLYRYDASYAVAVRNAYPNRFALVKPVDFNDPAAAEVVADWATMEGAVGIRIFGVPDNTAHSGLNRILSVAGRHSLAVNLLCFDRTAQAAALAKAHPDCRFAIDHAGMPPPRSKLAHPDPDVLRDLPNVLALAKLDNISIKLSGVLKLSAQKYPFDDIWEPLARVFDAYGFERTMWGTDWTPAVDFLSFREGVDAFRLNRRLSESERAMLMGGAVQKIYRWSPAGRAKA